MHPTDIYNGYTQDELKLLTNQSLITRTRIVHKITWPTLTSLKGQSH